MGRPATRRFSHPVVRGSDRVCHSSHLPQCAPASQFHCLGHECQWDSTLAILSSNLLPETQSSAVRQYSPGYGGIPIPARVEAKVMKECSNPNVFFNKLVDPEICWAPTSSAWKDPYTQGFKSLMRVVLSSTVPGMGRLKRSISSRPG